jgi:hypothetical protein
MFQLPGVPVGSLTAKLIIASSPIWMSAQYTTEGWPRYG